MKKAAQQTTATSVRQKNVVSAAVKAVIGEEEEAFDDIGEHPYSLDLPTAKDKIAKLQAACERLFLKLDIRSNR
jgi:hypothetical protein